MGEVKSVTSTIEESKAEVTSVLASATFARSPRMARLLRYLSDKIFAGESDQIKEYSIAVDLLGRPPSFDPSEDAIARVEVHRLRKKLKEFYEYEGAEHRVRIIIPSGSYVPIFVPATSSELPLVHPTPASKPHDVELEESKPPIIAPLLPAAEEPSARRRWPWVVGSLALLATLIIVWQARTNSSPSNSTSLIGVSPAAVTSTAGPSKPDANRIPAATLAPSGDEEAIRIAAGRKAAYKDGTGRIWGPDQYSSGGEIMQFPGQFVDGTPVVELFRSARAGNFQYNIPLGPGTWELRLYFVEMQYGPGMPRGGGEQSRVFHVVANDRRILSDVDIEADVGPRVADIRAVKDLTAAPDGRLHLNFVNANNSAMVSAIELLPSRPHRMNPIRIVVRDEPYKDKSGQVWESDTYWRGGRFSNDHANPVHDATDPELFARERYGHFFYVIPVGEGIYDVTLYLAETYWGPENPGGGGRGSRVFDVYGNGVALVRGLDVYAAVGANRAYPLKFKGLKSNPQGKLNLEFVPVRNYASIYALAVDDVTP
jgi:hypothetical protein